jgi:CubicO group peptidase (beta-lactamase class C family)
MPPGQVDGRAWRMKRLRVPGGAFLAAVVVACCAWLLFYSRETVTRAAQNVMQDEVGRGNFSGAVLVSRAGRIVFERAYGFADANRKVPNTTRTRFLVGSITKSFTAVLVMQLEQEKRISLSDSICQYLQECPPGWRVITLHHLLSHTSGIFNVTESPEFESLKGIAQTRGQMLARMVHQPLAFAAGEKFQYSNSNYYLLGIVIEKVTGDSFEHVLQRRILDPLGMHDTGMFRNDPVFAGQAHGYRRDAAGTYEDDPPMHESWAFSSGGMYSTLHDLATFSNAFSVEELVPRAALERMWRPTSGGYGYGFQTPAVSSWTFDRRMVEHGGRMPGFVSMFQRFPDDGITVIVLSNHIDAAPARVARGLGAANFGVPYQSVFERKPIKVSSEVMQRFAGEYEFDGMRFSLFEKDGGLFARVGEAPEISIHFESESAFFVDGMEGTVVALEDSKGAVTGLSVPVRGSMREARRLH